MVDIIAGLQDSDSILMDVLTEKTTPFQIVLTKADKLKKADHVEERADKIIS